MVQKQTENLIIKGSVFSIFGQMGPEAIFGFPVPKDGRIKDLKEVYITSDFTQQSYMQVAIKSIALLLSDYSLESSEEDHLEKNEIFGVLPYPDIHTIGFTYFTYYFSKNSQRYSPITLTLFIPEHHRSFIYDSLPRLKEPTRKFAQFLIDTIKQYNITSEAEAAPIFPQILPNFIEFFEKLQSIQSKPISPVTKHRRIKILFTGLENTGKTSFLLTIKRNFSALPSLLPTTKPTQDALDFLGTTILKWDIPGKKEIREEILQKSDIFIFETDVLYYFIDVQNPRIEENLEFLAKILDICEENKQKIPIIFILTKFDEDISQQENILQNLSKIKNNMIGILRDHPYKFFHTSIFSIYSVLNAFSYGLRQLSPNRPLLEHILRDFTAEHNIISSLLLNENGLVIASVERKHEMMRKYLSVNQVFEIAAPQFTIIAHQFSNLHPEIKGGVSKYQFSNTDFVFLYKFQVNDFIFFALFYSKNNECGEILEKEFPKFQKKIHNLLILYIK
ncbi:ADP-ribosylation factor-like protein [Candidatus Harpocratesius sp.]